MVSLKSFLVQNLKSLLLRKEKTSEKSYLWLFIEIKPRQSKCSLIYHVIEMSPHFLTTFHNFEASPVFCFPSLPLRKTQLTSVIQFTENKILLYKIKPIFPKLYEVPRNDEQIQCLLPYERLDRSNSQPIFEMINSDDPALLWKQELPTSSWKCSARSLTCYSYQSQIISLILVSASGVHIMAAGNNEWSTVALWKCCGNWLTHTMYHIKQASLKTFFPLFV